MTLLFNVERKTSITMRVQERFIFSSLTLMTHSFCVTFTNLSLYLAISRQKLDMSYLLRLQMNRLQHWSWHQPWWTSTDTCDRHEGEVGLYCIMTWHVTLHGHIPFLSFCYHQSGLLLHPVNHQHLEEESLALTKMKF